MAPAMQLYGKVRLPLGLWDIRLLPGYADRLTVNLGMLRMRKIKMQMHFETWWRLRTM
jgi:hypothetical protein